MRSVRRASVVALVAASVVACAGAPSGSGTPPIAARTSSDGATPSLASRLPSTGATSSTSTWQRPCVGAAPPARYDHVIWIVMENKGIGSVTGVRAPETARLAAACAWAVDHRAATHPSLPNYLDLTSGSTHGVRDDAAPGSHPIAGGSVFAQAAATAIGWATYAESMPRPCARVPSGRYAVKHNPAAYYTALRRTCAAHDLPLGTTTSGPLATALRTGRLPGFVLVVPDLCSDTHDCPVATGDAWLGRWLRAIVSSPVYAAGRTAVMVTWDENDGQAGNRVGLLVMARSVRPGTVIRARTTHEGLLRTTEAMLGLPQTLAPRAASFRGATHL